MKIYFKPCHSRVVLCVCIKPYQVINLNTHPWHHNAASMFSDRMKLFKFQNLIWDFKWIKIDFQKIEILGISLFHFYAVKGFFEGTRENILHIFRALEICQKHDSVYFCPLR